MKDEHVLIGSVAAWKIRSLLTDVLERLTILIKQIALDGHDYCTFYSELFISA